MNPASVFFKDAQRCAEKICVDSCPCYYDSCVRKNRTRRLPRYGISAKCPIAKYEVNPESTETEDSPYKTYPGKEFSVTKDELFAVCALCDRAALKETKRRFELEVDDCYADFCIDCPVCLVRDNMDESVAEYEYHFGNSYQNASFYVDE